MFHSLCITLDMLFLMSENVMIVTVSVVTCEDCQHFEAEAIKYLKQYGYLPTSSDGYDYENDHVPDLNEAIMKFQTFYGLKRTGQLNTETVKSMRTQRCGFKDIQESSALNFKTASKWRKTLITYHILPAFYPKRVSKTNVDEETRKAFKIWEGVTGLSFQRLDSRRADIQIKFIRTIDGPWGTLARAFHPPIGDAEFDDTEAWSVTLGVGTDLFAVLVHEFGHSLGLSHSSVRGAIMFADYTGWRVNISTLI